MPKLGKYLKPIRREEWLAERTRKAQEGLLNPHQGVDASHDDLMAELAYELMSS